MAIQPDGQLQTLAEDIFAVLYPTYPASPSQAQAEGRTTAIANTKKLMIKVMDYLVAQLEVKGVTTNLDSDAVSGSGAGTDSMGGVHGPATPLDVTASVTNKAGTQTNDGKNRVL